MNSMTAISPSEKLLLIRMRQSLLVGYFLCGVFIANSGVLDAFGTADTGMRISQMAEKLGIAPPDNFFVGIDDNFFVTEHPVKVGETRYEGRTLFASLPSGCSGGARLKKTTISR